MMFHACLFGFWNSCLDNGYFTANQQGQALLICSYFLTGQQCMKIRKNLRFVLFVPLLLFLGGDRYRHVFWAYWVLCFYVARYF